MRKNNDKLKQYSIIAVLVVICIGLLGLIFSVDQRNSTDQQMTEAGQEEASLTVAELNYSEDGIGDVDENPDVSKVKAEVEVINADIEEASKIVVEPIDADKDVNSEIVSFEKEEIEVPVVEKPDKPDSTPPEQKPETTHDLTNPDNEPEYKEEETIYVPELEQEVEYEEVRGSNKVPDSENPFLQGNIPSDGEGGAVDVEDISEYEPGTGDKF